MMDRLVKMPGLGVETTSYTWRMTTTASPLRKLVVDWVILLGFERLNEYIDDEIIPEGVLSEVVGKFDRLAAENGESQVDRVFHRHIGEKPSCTYHQHDESHPACKNDKVLDWVLGLGSKDGAPSVKDHGRDDLGDDGSSDSSF